MKSNLYNPTMPNVFLSNAVAWFGGRSEADFTREAEEKAAADAKAKAAAEEAARKKAAADAEAAAQAKAQAEAAAKAKQVADSAAALQMKSLSDPSSVVTQTQTSNVNANAAGTSLAEGTGQITDALPQVTAPTATGANTYSAATSADGISTAVDNLTAAQGTVTPDSTVIAAQDDPSQMAQLDLDVDQIAQAQVVAPTVSRAVETGELISGSAVDMAEVDSTLQQVQAAQATPTDKATVRGQLDELMTDFQGTTPPAWAAGALRNATSAMAARGLGASSMAGQALVQAAMESALPIAMADAQTHAKFESQNLSNRQQVAMFAAEQRANFLGMEFTQAFQTRVANAAKISDIANMNFTAEQTVALENARMAQTVDLENLGAANAKIMADAAALTNREMANLNNRQQAAVTNAQSFLQMDMKNMDLEQQNTMFKAQATIDAVFSDSAARNAAAQFNASSQNQTDQFYANMQTQVEQFNAGAVIDRQKFNAGNALIIAQANAQWRQNVELVNTAEQNEANRRDAVAANNITTSNLDVVWQRERDIMDYSFRMAESEADRSLSVFLADKEVDLAKWEAHQKAKADTKSGLGYVLGLAIG